MCVTSNSAWKLCLGSYVDILPFLHTPFPCPHLYLFACRYLEKLAKLNDKSRRTRLFSIKDALVWERPNNASVLSPSSSSFGNVALGKAKANRFLQLSCKCTKRFPSYSTSSHSQSCTQLSGLLSSAARRMPVVRCQYLGIFYLFLCIMCPIGWISAA